MKTKITLWGIIALAAVIGFSMTACDDGSGDTKPKTEKYEGTAEGTTYTLTIDGDSYVLTLTGTGGTKTSSGTVTKNGNTLTLTPSYSGAETFTVTVGPSGITDIDGEITLENGEKEDPPDTVTPKPPAGGSNPPLKVTGAQVYTYDDDGDSERTYTAFAGTGTAMDVKVFILSPSDVSGYGSGHDLGKIGTISGNGKLTLELPSTIADDKLFPVPNEYGGNGKVGMVHLDVSDGAYRVVLRNDSGGVIIEYFDRAINVMGLSVKKGWNYFHVHGNDFTIISDISNFKWVYEEWGGGE